MNTQIENEIDLWSSPVTLDGSKLRLEPMNVPTWNYAAVQMRGTVELIQDQKGINDILHSSVTVFEKQNGTD